MLILSENFSHLSVEALTLLHNEAFHYPSVLSEDPFVEDIPGSPLLLGDRESMYYSDILSGSNDAFEFDFKEMPLSRLFVAGFAIGSEVMRDDDGSGTIPWSTYRTMANWSIASNWSIIFEFMNETTTLFKITILISRYEGTCDIFFDNMDASLAEIYSQTGVPIDLAHKMFIEAYCDSTGAEGSAGTAKVAINGVTVAERTNIISSNINEWGEDPTNESSYFQRLRVSQDDDASYPFNYHVRTLLCDSIYLCNESGGYQDDFLGPVQITTIYPDGSHLGDQNNWVGYDDQVISDPILGSTNAVLVSAEIMDTENQAQDYIESDAENLREMYYMKNDVLFAVDDIDIVAVNFRTMVKKIFDYGENEFDQGLIALTKPTGNAISYETSSKINVDQYVYKPLDLYYGIVPNLAVPWTWTLLEETQFGFESTQVKHQLFLDDSIVSTEEVTDI